MTLQEEIELKSQEIHTENLSMSIGEILSMYQESEIDIHPEFQRFYRWSNNQKSKLIESIMLNIPIPSIFVAQRKDGIWDVVDGLQRLSTIFEFVGVLKNDTGKVYNPLILEKTNLLPSLEGKEWKNSESEIDINQLTDAQKRYFKRSRLNFVIIQKESDESSKFELFQRLNTGGSSLEPQEVRNCLLIMNDEVYFDRLKDLSADTAFLDCVKLSDKNIIEQYDKELVSRYLILKDSSIVDIKKITDLGSFLDEKLVNFFEENISDWDTVEDEFRRTFKLINQNIGSNAFKRYSIEKDAFYGGFIVSAFEMVAIGVASNLKFYEKNPNKLIEKIKACWKKIEEEGISWKGYSASGRLPKTLTIGKETFNES